MGVETFVEYWTKNIEPQRGSTTILIYFTPSLGMLNPSRGLNHHCKYFTTNVAHLRRAITI
jgi:hypothetical protein